MNIAGIDFDLNNNAIWIYLSGCKVPHCNNCQNEFLWNFDVGKEYVEFKDILRKHGHKTIVKRFFIAGGEPLDQDIYKLEDLLQLLNNTPTEIWLWTRFELEDIPKNILQYCDYVKTGEYKEELESYEEPLFGIKLASTNQKLIKIK